MKHFYNQMSTYSTLTGSYGYSPSNEQAAWFAIVFTAANIHGEISQEAKETFSKLITSKVLFRGHEILDYYSELMEIQDELAPKEIIKKAAKLVSPEHAPTLFCMVTETLLGKGYLTEKEEDILNFIGIKLLLDRATTDKIMDVILLKNKWNSVYN
ncbi:hypothetical protein OCK74_09685 [Chitinophagaceae bacterium LB-8]|uniref:TerB family tellurite resistance protein n=1 Tax=Paraflavisolibacter caeni TaxID=2982496 RepID=A0A9X2XVA1_9BACT|nr:hypothetical protein [Paraflavisolibacter caeni]MCU7549385.1 hypothetical protein [Paraflavisolibacter caeni]